MLEECNNCLCPVRDDVVTDELDRERALKENELERRRLISDLETCGITFPVSEFEMMAHSKLLEEYSNPEACPDDDCEGQAEEGDATISAENLTNEDYATRMPDDLKDLLRRYYQLEAEREELQQMAGMSTAPNSVNGEDEENQPVSLKRVSTPRAPFWYFRRSSVAIVENEGEYFYEAQERSGKSRHAWVPYNEGDDSSQKSRVTVVYPKERTRKIRMGLFCCCFVLLGLIAVAVYYAMDLDETTQEKESLDIKEETEDALTSAVTKAPTSSPTAQTAQPTLNPTSEPCIDEVLITGTCFVRSESFGIRFNNCVPLPDDWLGLYPAEADPSALADDFINWMYSCGNKQCRGVVQSSFYSFQSFETGTYRIHLIRSKDEQPYEAYASTETFDVVENRLDCPSDVRVPEAAIPEFGP